MGDLMGADLPMYLQYGHGRTFRVGNWERLRIEPIPTGEQLVAYGRLFFQHQVPLRVQRLHADLIADARCGELRALCQIVHDKADLQHYVAAITITKLAMFSDTLVQVGSVSCV